MSIKDIFTRVFKKVEEPQITKKTPIPPKQDISEPILSFVECVKQNPRRFFLNAHYVNCYYLLVDKQTKESWRLAKDLMFDSLSSISFLTVDERNYLIKELTEVFDSRAKRLRDIRKTRKIRAGAKERERLKTIYC